MPRSAAEPRRLLHRRELAAELGISVSTVQRLTENGMPCIRVPAAGTQRPMIVYRLDDVLAWLDGFKESATPAAPAHRQGRPRRVASQ